MRTIAAATGMAAMICVAAAARGDFGDPLPGITPAEQSAFTSGQLAFATAETPAEGLGPVFNDVSCAACHTGPKKAIGGNTTRTEIRFGAVGSDGSFDPLAPLGGSLIQSQGIGSDGIVATSSCAGVRFAGETVPPAANVTALRRTTPLFGLGLVDATPDSTFRGLASSQARNTPATAGVVNIVPKIEKQQANVVGRFGWKAQNATLHLFAGDAYVNEMGITNPTFPSENCPQGDCSKLVCLAAPELNDADGADVTAFTDFMTLLAPPPRGNVGPHETAGEAVFARIGCADCHTPTLTTGHNASAALDRVDYHPYSDFLLHDMGALGDGITQGNATGRLMRTAPLWGLGAQQTLLHDGSAKTIADAVEAHTGQATAARLAFEGLAPADRANLLAFLASL